MSNKPANQGYAEQSLSSTNRLDAGRWLGWLRTGAIGLFLLGLWAPTLAGIFGWDTDVRVNEKRLPAAFPALRSAGNGLRTFFRGLESYYDDHFGFRKRLIYWAQDWKRAILREHFLAGVIVGRDGWLYKQMLDPGSEEGARQTRPFTANELDAWRLVLEARRDRLALRGVPYLLVIAPEKATIYPEYLPAYAGERTGGRKLDTLLGYLHAHSTVQILDLRPTLRDVRRLGRVYLMTDYHWNELGAFAGSEEVIRALARMGCRVSPLGLDAFDIRTNTAPGGDLAILLAAAEKMPERHKVSLVPRAPLAAPVVTTADARRGKLVYSRNDTRTGKLLLFGDSFAEPMLPFLGQHFREVRLYWHYNFHPPDLEHHRVNYLHTWLPGEVERINPDVVLDEMIESMVIAEDPFAILAAERKDGKTYISRGNFGRGGHLDLSRGVDVDYAGQIRFRHANNAGSLRFRNNESGHFKPPADSSHQAPLPPVLFQPYVH